MPDVFMTQCPSVATILGSEVRVSILGPLRSRSLINWPIAHVSHGEIVPEQLRTQGGVPSQGARYDSYNGLQFGNARHNLTLGFRSTNRMANDPLRPVANQRVGIASVTIAGRVRFKYWNDHAFWWWPMGDGGDQGDAAGLQFSYNLAPHQLRTSSFLFEQVNLRLRLASGIPDRNSAKPMGNGLIYTQVPIPQVDRGDLDLSRDIQGQTLYCAFKKNEVTQVEDSGQGERDASSTPLFILLGRVRLYRGCLSRVGADASDRRVRTLTGDGVNAVSTTDWSCPWCSDRRPRLSAQG